MNNLVLRRQQLIETRTQETNRLHQAMQKVVQKDIKKHLVQLNKRIEEVDALIRSMIDNNSDWSEKDKIIQSVPGVGPYCQDSGRRSGKRRIRGGQANVRSALFMAAFNVVKQKGKFKDFFDGLLARGKCYKVAMTAVMRKLIAVLNVMLKTKSPWRTKVC